ncbi:CoA transferase [Thalassobaculum sp.]|uniref:CaiB/BaiF CoA transferase family protein n=1 Tax=Thalassobaculum sp. TaxID=2022740 RepID=UPI0032EB0D3B
MSDRTDAAPNPEAPTHEAPYRGLRVLDLGQGVASPYCGQLLAVYGAEVVKLEPPEGDWSRRLGTTYGGHSALSAVFNRGKRSLCLDLKQAAGQRIVRDLALRADVLIEGFRPGVAARLGLGYDDLAAENPGLVYVSVSGFGQTGPYAGRPGSDSVGQAFSGLVSLNVGADGIPHRVGATITDVSTGLYAFQAVATALFARAAVGRGRWIDVSLMQSTAALLGHKLAEHVLEGGRPRALNVPAGSYPTGDGWIMVTLVNEAQYRSLCRVVGRPDLAEDPRFADFARRADVADQLMPQIAEALRGDTTAAWLGRLHAADVIAERILDPREWARDPHVVAARGVVEVATAGVGVVQAPRTPGAPLACDAALSAAPAVGQDSRAVLREAGFGENEIDGLVAAGTVREPAAA